MSDDTHQQDSATIDGAQAIIERQQAEIERLNRQLSDARFADELRQALMLSATTSTIASPVKHGHLLEMIVETAAYVINAHAGALFLIDEEAQELIFEVALGQKADEVKKFRVPLGHGIAGLVAVSGQPMAISDAQRDSRQAQDISQKVDYAPDSILCVPLMYNDEVIGVLELLDKEGAPSFSQEDMSALFLFANLAAVAIEQSRTQQNLSGLFSDVLESLAGGSDGQKLWLHERARAFAANMEDDNASYRQALDLAQLVQDIVSVGETEAELCRSILRDFGQYARSKREIASEYGGFS